MYLADPALQIGAFFNNGLQCTGYKFGIRYAENQEISMKIGATDTVLVSRECVCVRES